MKKIELLVVPDRIDKMKAGIRRKLEHSFDAQMKFIAHFLHDGTAYLGADEALEYLDEMTMEELTPIITDVTEKIQEASASKK